MVPSARCRSILSGIGGNPRFCCNFASPKITHPLHSATQSPPRKWQKTHFAHASKGETRFLPPHTLGSWEWRSLEFRNGCWQHFPSEAAVCGGDGLTTEYTELHGMGMARKHRAAFCRPLTKWSCGMGGEGVTRETRSAARHFGARGR